MFHLINQLKQKPLSKAFTFIELIIVIGVIGISLPVIFGLFFITLQQQSKIFILQEVKRNGDYALNSMQSTIKQYAKKVTNSSYEEFCSSSNQSQIFLVDKYGSRFTYLLHNNKIASQSSTFPGTWYLTTDKVKVDNLIFRCSQTNPFSPPVISIFFTVSQRGMPARYEEKASMSYQTKIKLKSY